MSLPSPLLVVTDRHAADRPLVDTVRAVLEGGARWVWFRDRDMAPAPRRDLAVALLAMVREAGGRLTIGGDPDLAAAIGADGVHLGGTPRDAHRSGSYGPDRPEPDPPVIASEAKRSSPSRRARRIPGSLRFARDDGAGVDGSGAVPSIPERVAAARRLLGDSRLVGLSAHTLAECRAAAQAGADYVTLSPIFATPSKPGYGPALGLDALRTAAAIGIPVVALGGIEPDEARACRTAGAAGIAVMGGLMHAPDPTERTRTFLAALA